VNIEGFWIELTDAPYWYGVVSTGWISL